ncbi:hypothetical protein THAOC_16954 [Thalassiosira oceanica]|uniref:RNA 3'-terminal phosphate cyclase domain-containing protein n=1 Tax=Thalassiosira oceanica TaxID=159749 RepID=K0SAV9_THAOC|nr:hypothetical protein THAOC_16954 [Thalassiosira oceanica]|eukprot:EJK62435.1 hypothetical protein THAOC_16954 [Thalassiosira oceanica]
MTASPKDTAAGAKRSRTLRYDDGATQFRLRLAASVLSSRPLLIRNIRFDDIDAPGLREHEASFLRLLDRMTNGTRIEINATGTQLRFKPGVLLGGTVEHDCPAGEGARGPGLPPVELRARDAPRGDRLGRRRCPPVDQGHEEGGRAARRGDRRIPLSHREGAQADGDGGVRQGQEGEGQCRELPHPPLERRAGGALGQGGDAQTPAGRLGAHRRPLKRRKEARQGRGRRGGVRGESGPERHADGDHDGGGLPHGRVQHEARGGIVGRRGRGEGQDGAARGAGPEGGHSAPARDTRRGVHRHALPGVCADAHVPHPGGRKQDTARTAERVLDRRAEAVQGGIRDGVQAQGRARGCR